MKSKLITYICIALAFGLGFTAALFLGRGLSRSPEGANTAAVTDTASSKPGVIDPAGLAAFLEAAEKRDYSAMEKSGQTLFQKGTAIPDASKQFEPYAANSYPPYTVYAFYSQGSDDKVRRILLTLDGENRVESFLAEEMAVVQ